MVRLENARLAALGTLLLVMGYLQYAAIDRVDLSSSWLTALPFKFVHVVNLMYVYPGIAILFVIFSLSVLSSPKNWRPMLVVVAMDIALKVLWGWLWTGR